MFLDKICLIISYFGRINYNNILISLLYYFLFSDDEEIDGQAAIVYSYSRPTCTDFAKEFAAPEESSEGSVVSFASMKQNTTTFLFIAIYNKILIFLLHYFLI